MGVVFIGQDNSFNRKFICELFKDHELVCCLFVEIDRFSFKGRLKKLQSIDQKQIGRRRKITMN